MTDAVAKSYSDCVQHFQVEGPGLRGRMVRVGPELEKALLPHDHPLAVAKLLGETVAVALILSSSLKYEGIFTLQIKGDGPIATLMADVTSAGAFRCYASYDVEKLDALHASDNTPSLPRYLGAGHLAFTVDQGEDMERYQGITELTGASLTDCAHQYFQQSEQLQTAMIALADDDGRSAGALMVQQLPDAPGVDHDDDEDWRRTVVLMSSVTSAELLDHALNPADLLYRLFHEDGVRLYDADGVRNECRCSDKKVSSTLRSFPRAEVEDLREDGVVRVTCEFCKTDYVFGDNELDALFSAGETAG